MADVEIFDKEQNTLLIDVKTHCKEEKGFNMPNITSIKRLHKLYFDKTKYFMILFVDYEIVDQKPLFTNVWFLPIENLSWACLQIAALGIGQIQIKNSNEIEFDFGITREQWLNIFRDKLYEYIETQKKKLKKMEEIFFNGENDGEI